MITREHKEHQAFCEVVFTMFFVAPPRMRHPQARLIAHELLRLHSRAAPEVVEREVSRRVAANDVDGALEMDQVRREVLAVLKGSAV